MPSESPDPKPEPKFRRRADKRPDEVLDAALALFVEQGFARTTVDQVARRAGLSKGAVYLYFPSKKALLEGLVRRAVVPMADQALKALATMTGDPRPMIRMTLTRLAASIDAQAALAVPKLIVREAVTAPEIAEIYRRNVLDRMIPAMTTVLARAAQDGHIRPIDPELTVRSIVGPILAHVLLDEIFGIRAKGDASLTRLVDNHLTILFAGLEPEEQPR